MRLPFHRAAAILGLIALASACSGGGGGGSTPSAPAVTSGVGGGTPATAPPAAPSSAPATAAPAPTTTPIVLSTFVGSDCSVPLSTLPGYYTTFYGSGNVVGNTFTQDNSGQNLAISNGYAVVAYATAPPTPPPTPPPSPAPVTPPPSAAPIPSPTPGPVATPYYFQLTTYVGSYSLPGFSGTGNATGIGGPAGPFTAQATAGCFGLLLYQRVGGIAGLTTPVPAVPPVAPGIDNATTADILTGPIFSNATPVDSLSVAFGQANIVITNLTQKTGNGTVTLDNGASGPITITGSLTMISSLPIPVSITIEAQKRAFPHASGVRGTTGLRDAQKRSH